MSSTKFFKSLFWNEISIIFGRYSIFFWYIICLSIPESIANFEIEPFKVNIDLNKKSAIINVKNRDYKKEFYIDLVNIEINKPSNDLVITPKKFALEPDKTQTIRIMTKDGIKYHNNAYYIYLKTRKLDNKKIEGVNAFKIPVSFGDVEEPKLNKKLDNLANLSSGGGGGAAPFSSVNTQIRIVVPVSARVSK